SNATLHDNGCFQPLFRSSCQNSLRRHPVPDLRIHRIGSVELFPKHTYPDKQQHGTRKRPDWESILSKNTHTSRGTALGSARLRYLVCCATGPHALLRHSTYTKHTIFAHSATVRHRNFFRSGIVARNIKCHVS